MAEILKRFKKDGTPTFRAFIRKKGMNPIYKTFSTEEKAKEFIENIERTLQGEETLPHFPLSMWIDRYKDEVMSKKNPKMQQAETIHLDFWKNSFGNEIAIYLTPLKIELCADTLLKKISNRTKKPLSLITRHHYLKTLSFLYKIAIKEWKWSDKNPVNYVNIHTEEKNKISNKEKSERLNQFDKGKDLKLLFVEECKRKISINNYQTKDLKKLTSLSKTTLQTLLDPNSNSNFFMMVKLANALGLNFGIKNND